MNMVLIITVCSYQFPYFNRQEGDRDYADFLNRTRLGEHTEEDLTKLQARVRPEGHPDLKNALVIAATHEIVNKHNDISIAKSFVFQELFKGRRDSTEVPRICPMSACYITEPTK